MPVYRVEQAPHCLSPRVPKTLLIWKTTQIRSWNVTCLPLMHDDLINRRYAELRAELRDTNSTQSDAAAINCCRSELRVELEPRDINSGAQSILPRLAF